MIDRDIYDTQIDRQINNTSNKNKIKPYPSQANFLDLR